MIFVPLAIVSDKQLYVRGRRALEEEFNLAKYGWVLVGSAITICLRLLAVALIKEPAKILLGNYKVIRFLSQYLSFKHPVYSDEWELTWTVKSKNFSEKNSDKVVVYKFLHFVGALASATTKEGEKISYGFVGRLSQDILTGDWFDNRIRGIGYHGTFQVVFAKTLDKADGQWLGFSEHRAVKSGVFSWRKV